MSRVRHTKIWTFCAIFFSSSICFVTNHTADCSDITYRYFYGISYVRWPLSEPCVHIRCVVWRLFAFFFLVSNRFRCFPLRPCVDDFLIPMPFDFCFGFFSLILFICWPAWFFYYIFYFYCEFACPSVLIAVFLTLFEKLNDVYFCTFEYLTSIDGNRLDNLIWYFAQKNCFAVFLDFPNPFKIRMKV